MNVSGVELIIKGSIGWVIVKEGLEIFVDVGEEFLFCVFDFEVLFN